ncbi:MAG: 1-deoxy-D-xylulose-5-phosphate reductoisomerase [Alphaproteobacteria bacterium]|nr:1-deoxy-D-xylulose-5-phosphate reductoisomerase [Alphaproteobacteria bacterium]
MKTHPKTVTILGSTGSVGRSAVDLILGHRDKFKVRALTANKNVKLLASQARNLNAEVAVIVDKTLYGDLKEALKGTSIRAEAGHEAIVSAAGLPVDWVLAAIVGAAGIESTLEAIKQGTTVALANKESLVCAGPFMMEEVRKHGTTLLPVDSEHNAIFQVINAEQHAQIKRVVLTASGGPFLRRTRDELQNVTPEQAIKHPTWSMGSKISVDCATMMNKSLEIMEASYLFQLESEKIDVLIHPQSIVHSMVEYIDGSVLSQMGAPDMRTPLAHTMAWPERIKTTGDTLNLSKGFGLSFEPVDMERFPALKMAQQALQAGSGAPVVFNAANEVAVEAFLSHRLNFSEIERVVEETLQIAPIQSISSLQDVFQLDLDARCIAEKVVAVVD